MSVGSEMPGAIARARMVRDQLIELRGTPGVMVEPQITIITAEIDRAVAALASGDVVAILRSYEEIKGYEI